MVVVQVEVVSRHGVRDSTGIGPSAILLVISMLQSNSQYFNRMISNGISYNLVYSNSIGLT